MIPNILEAAEQIKTHKLSPLELTRSCLDRIAGLNPALNAFITVTAGTALEQARRAEAEIMRGDYRGPLHGIPIALKDLFDTAGVRTTAASALFKDRIPGEDAEVVRRLKIAGVVLVGKTNLHEFAYGGSSMVSYYGVVRNPWNPAYITGGSSGGSAAAVAAGLCCAALGTDTAGSIRLPAAICGLTGLKPTFGRVSNRGVVPLSWSLDHTGPMAQTVADSALLLQAIAGYDPQDPASTEAAVPDYFAALSGKTSTLRVGIPRSFFYEALHPEVAACVEAALAVLQKLTAEVREVSLPVPTDRTVQAAESYAFHAQFVAKTPELYQPETLRRILTGAEISAPVYIHHRRELEEHRHAIADGFKTVDVLVTPTTPIPPPTISELEQHPDQLRSREIVLLRNTRPFNVWGLPAISVPCGFTGEGLPVGLQIAGPHWKEETVLALAHAYERATEWHKRRPANPA
jgi:aspartyl-tRNA(Asn)/glutamyl-tRNA(Gln) amidotransferase subunit A